MTERRHSFRMPAVADFDQVVLRMRGTEVAGRLNDTSLTGLGVVCDSQVKVKVGERVEVRSDAGWYSARVVHVSPTQGGTLIGLERHLETSESARARKDESRLVAVIFAIAVVLAPLATGGWTYWRASGRAAANFTPPNPPATAEPAPAATSPESPPASP